MAYYNENDRHAAVWLRNLIRDGQLPEGEVDGRDIREVGADDVRQHSECHFFAGIGGWPYALRLAGWPPTRPIWTGSCPCQPFSSAGKRKGTEDSRHLWPEFRRLIAECRPPVVFGEQVASKDGRKWLAGIHADLETLGYRFGAADLCAASVASPHMRQRLYWVADAGHDLQPGAGQGRRLEAAERPQPGIDTEPGGVAGGMEHTESDGREQWRAESERGSIAGGCGTSRLADAGRSTSERHTGSVPGAKAAVGGPGSFNGNQPDGFGNGGTACVVGWGNFDIIPCGDGKSRRIESGTFPLVARLPAGLVQGGDHGESLNVQSTAEARVMRLRGYGNAIVPQLAAEFIAAYLEADTPPTG